MGLGAGVDMDEDDDEDLEAELAKLTKGTNQPKKGKHMHALCHVSTNSNK